MEEFEKEYLTRLILFVGLILAIVLLSLTVN